MNSTSTQKSRIFEAACRADFLSFFQALFPILNPGVPLKTNWHLEAMADHLELVLCGVIKRLIIAAPPRSLKSLMASVAFPAFALGRNPAARIIGISHNADLQIRFHNDCRLLIKHPRYQALFPRLELLKNTEAEFHSTMGEYRYAKSAEGGLPVLAAVFSSSTISRSRLTWFRTAGGPQPTTSITAQSRHAWTISIQGPSSSSASDCTSTILSARCCAPGKIGRCSTFRRLLNRTRILRSDRAGGITAA